MRDPLLKKRISRVTEDSTDEEITHLVDAIKASGAIEASEQVATSYLKKSDGDSRFFSNIKRNKAFKTNCQNA